MTRRTARDAVEQMFVPDGARASRFTGHRWLARLVPGRGRHVIAVGTGRD